MSLECTTKTISSEIKVNIALTQFDNISNYNDAGFATINRQARWQLVVDNQMKYDSGFVALAAVLPIGTGSTGNQILTPGGFADFQSYLLTNYNLPVTSANKVQLYLQVRSTATNMVSQNYITVVQVGNDWQQAATEPHVDNQPGQLFFSDTTAFAFGVPRFKYYRLAAVNTYSAGYAFQLRQLVDP